MTRHKIQSSVIKHPKVTFGQLVSSIRQAHHYFSSQANRAINVSLTLRNWVIGFYIREYEQNGADRAQYGQQLFIRLSQQLKKTGTVEYDPRELRRCRAFYENYPQIWGTLSPKSSLVFPTEMTRSLVKMRGTPPPKLGMVSERLVSSLSFSHFAELVEIGDPLKRAFYESECIRGGWSVRELKRQINSLLFERARLSKNKKKLLSLAHQKSEPHSLELSVRDPYVFEFLGLKAKEVMGESHLEDALLDKLEEFILELGHGFCFEARQKRINIGGEYFFVDLVFYHRILKCHVLIELKVDGFKHEYLGQLNTYVGYYAKHEQAEDDNPPIGILLCTKKNHALAEYALAGMNNKLFVSKYQVELPKKEEMTEFLETTLKQIE